MLKECSVARAPRDTAVTPAAANGVREPGDPDAESGPTSRASCKDTAKPRVKLAAGWCDQVCVNSVSAVPPATWHTAAESSRSFLHALSTRPASRPAGMARRQTRVPKGRMGLGGSPGHARSRRSSGTEGLGGCSGVLGTVTSQLGPLVPEHHLGVGDYRDKLQKRLFGERGTVTRNHTVQQPRDTHGYRSLSPRRRMTVHRPGLS